MIKNWQKIAEMISNKENQETISKYDDGHICDFCNRYICINCPLFIINDGPCWHDDTLYDIVGRWMCEIKGTTRKQAYQAAVAIAEIQIAEKIYREENGII